MTTSVPWSDAQRAHLGVRLVVGVNLAMHGVVRLPQLGAFAEALGQGFAATALPQPLIRAFAFTLPFVETALGVALLVGWRVRAVCLAGSVVLAALTFGSCLREQWEVVGVQLVYALAYYLLGTRAADLRFSLEAP